MPEIYIVSYCDKNFKPTVTAFSNEEAATRCFDAFRLNRDYKNVCLDKVPVYNSFVCSPDLPVSPSEDHFRGILNKAFEGVDN